MVVSDFELVQEVGARHEFANRQVKPRTILIVGKPNIFFHDRISAKLLLSSAEVWSKVETVSQSAELFSPTDLLGLSRCFFRNRLNFL